MRTIVIRESKWQVEKARETELKNLFGRRLEVGDMDQMVRW